MEIFGYLDYREYLKERYTEEKAKNRHFSFRFFARVAGFSSSGFLKMVMEGERNLTPTSINQCAKALKLAKKEAAYFEALVLFNQASSDRERDLYFERLSALRPKIQLKGLEKDQYEYFTQKHFVIIREMAALPHFREDPAWIGRQLQPPLPSKEVERTIEVLFRLKLLKRNEEGRLTHTDAGLTTPAEVDSGEVYRFQQGMLNDAKQALLTVPADLRDITSLTVPIPREALKPIKEKIMAFREEILDFINKGSSNYFEVYQLNLQLFPVTQTREEGSK